MLKNNFNIIITGVGGQGVVTLLSILDQAALIEGNDVKSSELHGLSQRGGSVETHVKFGEKVYSPLVFNGQADLIIGLEMLEGLRAVYRASAKTKFLVNDHFMPFIGSLTKEDISNKLKNNLKDKLFLVPASEICTKELGNEVVSGIYLLGYASFNNLIPLRPESIERAIEKIVPGKYLELNKKAFLLSKNGK